MNRSGSLFFKSNIFLLALSIFPNKFAGAQPTVQIRSPQNGSHVVQEQSFVLVSGKVASASVSSSLIDLFLVIDVSGSTAQPAGAGFSDFFPLPNFYVNSQNLGGLGLPCAGPGGSGRVNLRNSILATEVMASRRLLSQLNPEMTRVGVITFGDEAWLRQPLTHDFEQVHSALDLIYKRGPYGGTNMVGGIQLARDELLGKGESEKYLDSTKTLFFFTDGFPTRPKADCSSADADLAINEAQLAAKSGISIHVFALGEEALSNPRAAIGIAKDSGGTYTPVTRPADVLAVVDKVSAVGVNFLHVTNETTGQKALQSRLAADGFFASAVPLVPGLNKIQVLVRSGDGMLGKDAITVYYQPGAERSLDLEVFLEREKSLKLEVERLGKTPEQIQTDIERNREESLKKSAFPPRPVENFSR